MKRSPLVRKTPLRATKPMARGTVGLRAVKPKAAKPKRAAREAEDKHLADLCHGQACYLLVPDIALHERATVVPAHSNQYRHGKAKGLKAHHRFTAPGCFACHAEIDQGMRFSKPEKFALWDAAYARWEIDREKLLQSNI